MNELRRKMTAPTLNRTSDTSPLFSFLRSLTQPANTLSESNKSKAQLLAGAMLVFLLLGVLAASVEPLSTFVKSGTVTFPTSTSFVGVVAILVAYLLSRSRYYRVSAWLAVLNPLVAIVLPVLSTGTATTAASLFFLALSVILAGLLLSSNET